MLEITYEAFLASNFTDDHRPAGGDDIFHAGRAIPAICIRWIGRTSGHCLCLGVLFRTEARRHAGEWSMRSIPPEPNEAHALDAALRLCSIRASLARASDARRCHYTTPQTMSIPTSENALLIRTDFSDQSAQRWAK